MCFIQRFGRFKSMRKACKGKIAKEDITVYKCLFREEDGSSYKYVSPFKNCKYKEGFAMASPIAPSVYFPSVGRGFTINIDRGVHSYGRLIPHWSGSANTGIVAVEMVIPKGTRYFKNEDGEVVSELLKWPKEAKIHKF